MNIVIDENIFFARKLFSKFGNVTLLPGRLLTAEQLIDLHAEILLVRSVTKVNETLLKNTRVQFVGTATSGTDHIDQNYLQKHNIAFCSALGCNANSVVEYVIAALHSIEENYGFYFHHKHIGIVGLGNIGSCLSRRLKKLGIKHSCYDPYVKSKQAPDGITLCSSLRQLILRSDIVTLHTPLVHTGNHPTYHMIDEHVLEALKPNAILINTSRGAVIDSRALLNALSHGSKLKVILDVWENEPHISRALMNRATIATPHIAGYSIDGKIRGSEMLCWALARYFGDELTDRIVQESRVPPLVQSITFSENASRRAAVNKAIQTIYNIKMDDFQMRQVINQSSKADIGYNFDHLRGKYHERREFETLTVGVPKRDSRLYNLLSDYGFSVKIA